MNCRVTRLWFIVMMATAMSLSGGPDARGQTNAIVAGADLDAQERKGCIRNLKLIYDAIQAYQFDHKDIPNWLSDLVPQYLSDANVLICPVCKRTGQAETSELADPKLPCSYLYEFCPVTLKRPRVAAVTHREWKRRQMGLVGSVVPIVRCWHHQPTLNLAFDGKIYESPPIWETTLSNRVDVAKLTPEKLFPQEAKPHGPGKNAGQQKLKFPKRDAQAKKNQINLNAWYNATFKESWHGGTNNNLAALPVGLETLAGVEFDVRGIVQLGSKSPSVKGYPPEIKGLKIHQKCRRLIFLHAVAMGTPAEEGKAVGSYIVHFATNQMRLDIPIIYGKDVRDWHLLPKEKPATNELTVAWSGTNAVADPAIRPIRLFKTTWVNVAPEIEIESIDYVSAMGIPAPFLVAITTE